jgi:hypothetical protein
MMERLRLRGLELFYRSRQHAGKYLVGTGIAVVVALWVSYPIYDAVAQTSDATDNGTLTVEECLGNTNASIDPIAEDLIAQGIIAEDLLPTKVTDGMCEEMLEQAADGTLVGRLVAAQNYVQDIKLIEYTIREATGEAAAKRTDAKGPDHHFVADKPFALPRWTALGATEEGSTDGDGIGALNVEPAAFLQDVVQDQYDDGGGGGGGVGGGGGGGGDVGGGGGGGGDVGGGGGGGGDVSGGGGGGGDVSGGGGGGGGVSGGGGGGGDGTGVAATPRAASADQIAGAVVAESDAPIADILDQIETDLIAKGIPRSEAVVAARCGLETALLNATIKKISRRGSIEVRPDPTPKEMVNGETILVTLVVSGAIREFYEKLERQYQEVAEASEAKDGCPLLSSSIKGDIYDHHFAVNPRQGALRRPISSRDMTWRWNLTAITEGENSVDLFLGYELKHAELELRPKPTIASHETITVKEDRVAQVSNSIERNWWWLLPVGITLVVAAAWLLRLLRKREQ